MQCANGGSNDLAAITAAASTTAAAATAAAATTGADFGDDDGDDGTDCGFPTPVTIVEGPSTVAYSVVADDS